MPYRGLKQITILLLISLFSLSGCTARNDSAIDNNRAKIKDIRNADNRLDVVKERGSLICGVNGQLPGFSSVDSDGNYSGIAKRGKCFMEKRRFDVFPSFSVRETPP